VLQDLLIYDEEMDQLKHISFEQALLACGVLDIDLVTHLGATFVAQLTATPSPPPGAERNAKQALINGPTLQTLIACVKAGVWVPICITICRPFIEHLMMSCVATVSGRDTGATLFGPADMQISANTSVKTIEGHYTCHTKSVITKPQNVYVMRDVMCSGYVAGGNTRFFGTPEGGKFDATAGAEVPATDEAVLRDLNARLSFADDASGDYCSMLAFLSPYAIEVGTSSRDQVISISDRLLPWEVSKNADPSKSYFPGGPGVYDRYKAKFNLSQIHFGEDVRATENMAFMSQGSVNNSLCFLGPHRKYNPFAQNFYELVPGQGHFGPDAIPGDARWRRGESVSLKTARDSMVSLEVAAHSQLALRPAQGI
jgi:hypothetical protein